MKFTKAIIAITLLGLAAINIFVFVSSSRMSDQIAKYNSQVEALSKENMLLEARLYEVDSLSHAASEAAILGYTQKVEPQFLKNTTENYALRAN